MVAPLDRSLVCPVVVGRTSQVAALHGLLDEARRSCGAAALLVGEAGVGKTRLAGEARAYALARGFRVVQGSCFAQDTACPYAPLLDLLRAHFADPAELGPGAGALHPLLPDLIPPPLNAPPPLDAEQERRRLFAALVQAFLHLAARQPLLAIIEDLHWSDDASLEVLHLLMRRATGHPLLLLMTYRADEVGPSLRHWLAQLDRQRLARELSLAPLGLAEVEAMLRAIARALKPGGIFLMMEIAASSDLADNLDHPFGPFLYAASVFHCMTVSLAQGGPGLGTLWGEQGARRLLAESGFAGVDMHQLAGDLFHSFYIARRD